MSKYINIDTTITNQVSEYPLSGTPYQLHCYWNGRSKAWYIALYENDLFDGVTEESEDALLYSRKVMPNQSLLSDVNVVGLPDGILFCEDTEGLKDDEYEPTITLDNFGAGKRFVLVYIPLEDLQSFLS